MHDPGAHLRALLGAEPPRGESPRPVRLQEHIRVAQQRAQFLRVRGDVEVELCRALAARGFDVQQGERGQARGGHMEDVRAMRWWSYP